MSDSEEIDKLSKLLNAEEIPPALWQTFSEFRDEDKNGLMAQIARTFDPPPSGRLLTRLLTIVTEQNKPDLAIAFLVNLHSAEPEARAACLRGLEKLEYTGVIGLAIASLRDSSDRVLAAACSILIPKAKQDVGLWRMLQEVYASHKGKPEFYITMSLLEAHSIQK
jgi:hypothetical protein